MQEQQQPLHVYVVSHTHWDREWYMSLQPFTARFVKMMDRLLDILEGNPRYRTFHMDGQVLPVKDYLELRPHRRELLTRMLEEGRIVLGPWYSPPTESLVSGESMIRNLLMGMRETKKLGGAPSDICWIVDNLGHVSQMPMICAGMDLHDYVAWRGMPKGAPNVFLWEGPDGSQVLVHSLIGDYNDLGWLPEEAEDHTDINEHTPFPKKGLRSRIKFSLESRATRSTCPHILMLNGRDHSFAQKNLPALLEQAEGMYPHCSFRHASLAEYAQAVRACHEEGQIPFARYSGELMDSRESPVLTPINSIHTPLKAVNARVEALLEQWAEPFASYAWMCGASYPHNELDKAWELVLQNHSHDTLGCSSVDAVYRHTVTRYEWARDTAGEILTDSLAVISAAAVRSLGLDENELAAAVYNPLSWARSGPIRFAFDVPVGLGFASPAFYAGEQRLPLEIRGRRETISRRYHPLNGWAVYIPVIRYDLLLELPEIPANGYAILRVRDGGERPNIHRGSQITGPGAMENENIAVQIQPNGTFDLCYKPTGRWYRGLHLFQDDSETGSGFARQQAAREQIITSWGCEARISLAEDSAFQTTFRVELALAVPARADPSESCRSAETAAITLASDITLARGGDRVEVKTTVQNRARDHRLRVMFPTGLEADTVFAGMPFDVVERPVRPEDPSEYPAVTNQYPWPERPQNGFVDYSNGDEGLTVAAQGLYEYELVYRKDRPIALTLLRALHKLEFGGHAENEEEYMELAQLQGSFTFRYAVIPHRGVWRESYRSAQEFRHTLRTVPVRPPEEAVLPEYVDPLAETTLPAVHSFLQIDREDAILSAVKRQEERDTLLVRVFHYGEREAPVLVRPDFPGQIFVQAYETNLAERRLRSLLVENGAVTLMVKPHSVATAEFVPARAAVVEEEERV